MKLTDFKLLSLDCYGTLIDWETGLGEALAPLVERAAAPLSRGRMLQAYARHESSEQRRTPSRRYSELLSLVFRRLADEWRVEVTPEECAAFGRTVKDWPAFPDSAPALRYLKDHYRLAILSNVDNDSFRASQARLGVEFDAVYTAEDIGSYKPSDRNFEFMLDGLRARGIERGDILHTAQSLFHDHAPANRHGLASCWIRRSSERNTFGATPSPAEMPRYDFRFDSLAELVEAHRESLARR